MAEYTLREMMTIVAAREIRNGDIVFCGTGISMLAAMAAKNINAPESVMFFETGAIDAKLDEIPLAVADSRVMYLASTNGGLFDAFTTMQNPITGGHVIGILGAAQIDIHGNINTTVIGNYVKPKTRFPGKRRWLRRGLVRAAVHSVHAAGEEAIHEPAGLPDKPGPSGRRRRAPGGRLARRGARGRDHEHGGFPV